MNREKLKEKEESREKSKTISEVRERDLVSDIDELIRVSADSRGEIYFKLKLIELFNDFVGKNYFARRDEAGLYKSIKYDDVNKVSWINIPLNRKLIVSEELYSRLSRTRGLLNGNMASLVLTTDADKFLKTLKTIECNEVKQYINCDTVKSLNAVITREEDISRVALKIYIKLNNNALIQVTKFVKKHRSR